MAKKNLRLIPLSVRNQLKRLEERHMVAAYSRAYTNTELSSGVLKHLGVILSSDGLSVPDSIVPPAASGKYSDKNVNGYEIIRRDLPKETHYNSVETPNWGDPYNGTHTVDLPYEKYPRDAVGPRLTPVKITANSQKADQSSYLLIFEVDQILDRRDPNFDADLLECLNLLQENVGGCGVHKAGATVAEYLATTSVAWEILPPGTREEAVARIFRGREPTDQQKSVVGERYDFLMGLHPKQLIYGTSGLQRYFGALLDERLVVFENVEYGNAIYIMFNDWKELSKRTRTELLSGRYGKNFERVQHGSGWQDNARAIILEHQTGQKAKA